MNWLLQSSFARDIGMALVHSLWQILLVAAGFAIANRLLARRSANLRYVVAYASLVVMLVLPTVTLMVISAQSEISQQEVNELPLPRDDSLLSVAIGESPIAYASGVAFPRTDFPVESTDVQVIAATEALSTTLASAKAQPTYDWKVFLPWLSIVWACGVITFSLRPFFALHRCYQLRNQAQPIASPWITETLESLCVRFGLRRKVEIAGSALVHVPTVMGFVRPIILLPLSMVSGQTPHELSAIIAHELAHIRRHDFLLNLFQTAIETLLFYHPAAWWVSAVVRQERENCCDDMALAVCGRKNYATALANLESARSRQSNLAMAADGGSLYPTHSSHRPPPRYSQSAWAMAGRTHRIDFTVTGCRCRASDRHSCRCGGRPGGSRRRRHCPRR